MIPSLRGRVGQQGRGKEGSKGIRKVRASGQVWEREQEWVRKHKRIGRG